MRLNLVSPRTGLAWAKQGVRIFFKQPLAMSGLFFIFIKRNSQFIISSSFILSSSFFIFF